MLYTTACKPVSRQPHDLRKARSEEWTRLRSALSAGEFAEAEHAPVQVVSDFYETVAALRQQARHVVARAIPSLAKSREALWCLDFDHRRIMASRVAR